MPYSNFLIYKAISRFKRRIIHPILLFFKVKVRLKTNDRIQLEQLIFNEIINNPRLHSILFVGCDYYNKHYSDFFLDKDYWTIEPSIKRSKYGSKDHHISDYIQNLEKYDKQIFFDVIIMNGVYGWGLNAQEDIEKAILCCYDSMKKDGIFILGWNNIPQRTPVPLETIKELRLFKLHNFIPGTNSRLEANTANNHIFDFYIKE